MWRETLSKSAASYEEEIRTSLEFNKIKIKKKRKETGSSDAILPDGASYGNPTLIELAVGGAAHQDYA